MISVHSVDTWQRRKDEAVGKRHNTLNTDLLITCSIFQILTLLAALVSCLQAAPVVFAAAVIASSSLARGVYNILDIQPEVLFPENFE